MSSPASSVEIVTSSKKSMNWMMIFGILFVIVAVAVIYLVGRMRKQEQKIYKLENKFQGILHSDDVYPIVTHYVANPVNRSHLRKHLDFLFEPEVPVEAPSKSPEDSSPQEEESDA